LFADRGDVTADYTKPPGSLGAAETSRYFLLNPDHAQAPHKETAAMRLCSTSRSMEPETREKGSHSLDKARFRSMIFIVAKEIKSIRFTGV